MPLDSSLILYSKLINQLRRVIADEIFFSPFLYHCEMEDVFIEPLFCVLVLLNIGAYLLFFSAVYLDRNVLMKCGSAALGCGHILGRVYIGDK